MTTTANNTRRSFRGGLPAGGAGRGRRGFTLIELLATIAIIVILLAMAVPLFRVMSGSGSVEGAQNMASAMLQRARSRAIGMQAPRGVFFFEDQATRRTAMALVKIDDANLQPNTTARVLELDESADELQLLPTGVGVAFMLGQVPQGGTAGGPTTTVYQPYGLVAFDGVGRVMPVPGYMLRPRPTDALTKKRYPPKGGSGDGYTELVERFQKNIGDDVLQRLGTSTLAADQVFSHAALIMFDDAAFAERLASTDPTKFSTATDGANSQSEWLDQNGVAVAVNRYTGTILKGE
jgi:prepilin-type N-terminal cleavage/methylation domain-containing protein